MTEVPAVLRRTVTLRTSAGKPVVALPAVTAAAAFAATLALAPRFTALAAVAALLRKMSLTLDGAPPPAG